MGAGSAAEHTTTTTKKKSVEVDVRLLWTEFGWTNSC
jgi:hypothetical protein